MSGRQSVEQETEIAAQACTIPTIPTITTPDEKAL
jgi:hypothetical protein